MGEKEDRSVVPSGAALHSFYRSTAASGARGSTISVSSVNEWFDGHPRYFERGREPVSGYADSIWFQDGPSNLLSRPCFLGIVPTRLPFLIALDKLPPVG